MTPCRAAEGSDEGFEDLSEEETKDRETPVPILTAQEEEEGAMQGSEEAKKRRTAVLNLISTAKGSAFRIGSEKSVFPEFFFSSAIASISNYTYDVDKELWCELTLTFPVGRRPVDMSNVVRKACEKAVIKEVKNIKRYSKLEDNFIPLCIVSSVVLLHR